MSDFARFELEDGSEILFETAGSDLVHRHGATGKPTDGGVLSEQLAGAAETAETVARTLRSRLTPSELSLELGLKVSGQANWFFAKSQAEGTIKVTLKWADPSAVPVTPARPQPAAEGAPDAVDPGAGATVAADPTL